MLGYIHLRKLPIRKLVIGSGHLGSIRKILVKDQQIVGSDVR